MKVFKSEFINDYNTYTFSYAEYAVMENSSDITNIYSNGFLPYTANVKINYPVFYLARSLRVNTSEFKDSSENRRVDRKSGILDTVISRTPLAEFDITSNEFIDFCLNYAGERFSGNAMNPDRFKYILSCGIATDIFEFRKDNALLGYVIAVIYENTFHYWFSFFDSEYLNIFPIGKWMMWKMIKWSKENGIKYVYLGTTYGKKALYKIRDFKGLEFFNGNNWDNDLKRLKLLCKKDDEHRDTDYFKSLDNPNEYLDKIK